MSNPEQNKALVLDFHERINQRDYQGAGALCAEDLVNHAALPSAQGRAGLTTIFTKLHAAFPDMKFTAKDVLADGDRVAVRGVMTGTNTGPLTMALVSHPATGRAIEVEHIHWFRLAGGKIVEHWAGRDDIGMFRQIGLLERLK